MFVRVHIFERSNFRIMNLVGKLFSFEFCRCAFSLALYAGIAKIITVYNLQNEGMLDVWLSFVLITSRVRRGLPYILEERRIN